MRSCAIIAYYKLSSLLQSSPVQCPVPPLKTEFYSYLAENIQKATVKFYFKSRFSVKPGKIQIYFEFPLSGETSRLSTISIPEDAETRVLPTASGFPEDISYRPVLALEIQGFP